MRVACVVIGAGPAGCSAAVQCKRLGLEPVLLDQEGRLRLQLRPGNWQNQFLYAPAFHIGGGTDEIQKNIAAERVLRLPREPATDREVPFDELPRS